MALLLSALIPMAPRANADEADDREQLAGAFRRSDESAEAFRANLARLKMLAARAPRKIDQATAHTAWANALLAQGFPEALTRVVLGCDRPDDQQVIRSTIQQAFEHLGSAAKLLDAPHATSATAPADEDLPDVEALRRHIGLLRHFAEAMEALVNGQSDQIEDKESAIRAARNLAIARESEDPQIASAALFWQSVAWANGGRSDRALRMLPTITDTPKHWPWDFFAIVFRCRLLGRENQSAAAVALAIQLGRRVSDWSDVPISQEAVQHTIQVLQVLSIDHWLGKTEPKETVARDNLKAIRKSILTDAGIPWDEPSPKPRICLLDPAIPILVTQEKPDQSKTKRAASPDTDEQTRRSFPASGPATTNP